MYSVNDMAKVMAILDKTNEYTNVLVAENIDAEAEGTLLYGAMEGVSCPPSGEPVEVLQEFGDISGVNSQQLELPNEGVAFNFLRYLNTNGGWVIRPTLQDGSCLFAAIRKQLDVCYEFTTQHLRRWLVYRMIVHHHQFFFNLFKDAIAKVYGFYRYSPGELAALKKKGKGLSKAALKEQKMPGPFTFKDWIQYLLDPHGWGDNMVIMAFSLLSQTCITVVRADTTQETRIRHDRPIHLADILLVFCGLDHYTGAGKHL